jgi:hypothetical protein
VYEFGFHGGALQNDTLPKIQNSEGGIIRVYLCVSVAKRKKASGHQRYRRNLRFIVVASLLVFSRSSARNCLAVVVTTFGVGFPEQTEADWPFSSSSDLEW